MANVEWSVSLLTKLIADQSIAGDLTSKELIVLKDDVVSVCINWIGDSALGQIFADIFDGSAWQVYHTDIPIVLMGDSGTYNFIFEKMPQTTKFRMRYIHQSGSGIMNVLTSVDRSGTLVATLGGA